MNGRDHQLAHGSLRVVDIGEGPALVMIHGLGGNWRNWLANLPGLAERHRVIAFDLPGFGASDRYAGAVTMERYADTVIELLDHLGVETATLVGNSMGGLLAIEVAARYPDRVDGAILVASGGLPLTSRRHRFILLPQARATNRLMANPLVCAAVSRSPWVRRVIVGQIFHDPSRVPGPILAAALQGLGAPGFGAALDAGRSYDARVRAPLMSCPTLVLWGREDRLLPISMGEELARLIPGSLFVVWQGIGHCPMLEDPVRFNELVADFMSEKAVVAL